MLGNRHVGMAVAGFLERHHPPNVVVDPIIHSSNRAELLDGPGQDMIRNVLLPLADVITPNTDEAAFLAGFPISGPQDLQAAAEKIQQKGTKSVVITGGHLDQPLDFLLTAAGTAHQFPGERVESCCTHGTGCAFATALACNLALGKGLVEGVRLAQQYVRKAIRQGFPVGRGIAPINHLCDM